MDEKDVEIGTACMNEIQEVLKKHGCGVEIIVSFSSTRGQVLCLRRFLRKTLWSHPSCQNWGIIEVDYKPDRSFLNELKRTDPRLDCRFNGQFFVLTYERPCGGSVPIMSVRGEGGGFRQPDQRDIMKLKESDLAREDYREKFMRMGKMSEYLTEQEKARRKRKETFRDMTKDNRIQLRNAFAKAGNVSKSNAGFRQVNYKPKGKVFRKEQSP